MPTKTEAAKNKKKSGPGEAWWSRSEVGRLKMETPADCRRFY